MFKAESVDIKHPVVLVRTKQRNIYNLASNQVRINTVYIYL